MAKAARAQLVIVHVLPPVPLVGEGYLSPTTWTELLRGQRTAAQRQLTALLARARAAGVRASMRLFEVGVPHERIVRAARRRNSDLIVMGTHGRTGLTRTLLGSVAARVIATAVCPVLTVHAK